MPKYLEKIYLDSTIIIAWLKDEKRPNDEMEGVEYCIKRIMESEIKAITSVNTNGEILEGHFLLGTINNLERILYKRRNFEIIAVDLRVSKIAQEIRSYYLSRKKLELPDATHLATAIYKEVDAFYTFDEDDLLPLNGNVAGHNLIICKPPLPKQTSFKF